MMALSLAWRQLRSHWASGEVRVLLMALVLAVAATTAVGFFTDRVESALSRQGALLLGADMVISADHVLPKKFLDEAGRRRLEATQAIEFPSMIVRGDLNQLAEIKAVGEGFPLRGELTIAVDESKPGRKAGIVPVIGTVWIEPRLANVLAVGVGDNVEVGERELRVSAILQNEPSRGGDMFSFAPRLMMNAADVTSTGLIQYGSRVKYNLLVASDAGSIRDYSAWATSQLGRGEKVQDLTTARPEIKSALEKAQKFLGLSAMVGVILAMTAIFLASLPYVQSSLDTYALMRCFGASRQLIVGILLYQTLLLALIGSVLGCLLGYFAQAGLAALAGSLFLGNLPEPGPMPILPGMVLGFSIMLTVVWPHLLRLRDVPALRILRRDLGNMSARKNARDWLSFLPALLVMIAMIFWHAGDPKLAGATFVAFIALLLVTGLLAIGGGRFLQRLPDHGNSAWKLGLAGLRRRPAMATAQIIGLSLGLMAMILLALVRVDLLQNWQKSLPPDAPNKFIINIQSAQIEGIKDFFANAGIGNTEVFPMVRGRLVALNDAPLDTAKYQDERARRLAEREFNLSWSANMQSDNQLVSGRWWTASERGSPLISLEDGLAESLGIGLGDRLTYDIAGTRITVTVSSLRKVEWDTMRANFFAVAPPGVLDAFAASYITSFYLPAEQSDKLNLLVRQFPNLTVIDVAALMEQVRGIMEKMSYAVEYVFGFSLLAGLAVLYATLVATRQERVREATLLRVLGASGRQVVLASLAEFVCIGVLAASVATIAANALAYYVSAHVLNIPYQFNFGLAVVTLLTASTLVPLAAWIGIRGFIRQPPRQLLQSI